MVTASEDEDIDVAAGLVRLSFLVQGVYAQASERHELTPAQAKLLCILAARPRGMAELADLLGVEKAALTGLVDRVERRRLADLLGVEKAALTGLVDRVERRRLAERSAVPGDRRAIQVTLTPEGRRAAAAFHAEVSAEVAQLAAELPPADRERLRQNLACIIENHGRPAVFPATCNPRQRC